MVIGWIRKRRALREAVAREAAALLEAQGDMAYPFARLLARTAREHGNHRLDRYWSKVAVAIADKTGRVIGQKTPWDRSP